MTLKIKVEINDILIKRNQISYCANFHFAFAAGHSELQYDYSPMLNKVPKQI